MSIADDDITVTGSWSEVGCEAKDVSELEPTLTLDLRGLKPLEMQATILHEFGHVYGLGHEHQHHDYWNVMRKFLDLEAMWNCSHIKDKEDFLRQFTEYRSEWLWTEADFTSIMFYP